MVLPNIRWETYERLLSDLANSSAPRLMYDRGTLEILKPLQEHEELNRTIALLVEVIAEERNLDIENLGSTTFKREDLERGFEPDSCFYVKNAARIHGKTQVDLTVDPPPDLVMEIDLTHSSLNKLPIYAHFGVPEVWRCDGKALAIYRLEGGVYSEREESLALQGLGAAALSEFIGDSKTLKRPEWLRKVRAWARAHGSAGD